MDRYTISAGNAPSTLAGVPTQSERKASEVENQLASLDGLLDSVGNKLQNLQDRLCTVTRPTAEVKNPSAPEPVLVPLAAKLRHCNSRLELMHLRLIEMLDGLEL